MKKITLCLMAMLLCIGGVAQAKLLEKAAPAESTGFTDADLMTHRGDLPFNSAWKAKDANFDYYTKIYISPISTAYLKENNWWNGLGLKDADKDVETLAENARTVLQVAFDNDPEGRFRVVQKPDDRTLIVEMAITELVPNKAGFEAALTAASLGAGELAVSAASAAGKSIGSKSSVAFEMRLRDGGTKKVVGMLADREQEQASPINIKNYSWYGHANAIIKTWADQLVKVANKAPGDIVADSPTFSLKPW